MKGVPYVNGRYTKWVSFLPKTLYKRVMVGPRGGASPYFFLVPPGVCM